MNPFENTFKYKKLTIINIKISKIESGIKTEILMNLLMKKDENNHGNIDPRK